MYLASIGNGYALAGGLSSLGGFSATFLGDIDPSAALFTPRIIYGLLFFFFLLLTAWSFPMWLASKIAIPNGETSYGRAIRFTVSNAITLTALIILSFVVNRATTGGKPFSPAASICLWATLILVQVLIVSATYGIGGLHAFGVYLLCGVIILAMNVTLFLGAAVVLGRSFMTDRLASSWQTVLHANEAGDLPVFPAPSSDSTTPPPPAEPADYTAEINSLLNAALHPTGPAPSLAEREDMVRSLQQKLQAQRNNLPAGGTQATNIYQNQFNRYMYLLEQVKAERKAKPLTAAPVNVEAAR